jgi:hypothetical protein
MPAHDTQSFYFSGQGVVLMASRDEDGNPEGFLPIGNCPALNLSVAVQNLEHRESTTGARGIDLRLVQEINTTVNITMESINQENLRLGLYGATTAVSAVTTGAEKTITIKSQLGKIFDLGHLNVTGVTATAGATPVVVNKNFILNAEAGSIRFMTTAEQTEAGAADMLAEDIDVTFTFLHGAYSQLDALTEAQPERWLRFEGLNTARDNEPVIVDVFRFAADPLQELALITEELGEISVQGSALADLLRTTGSRYFRIRSLR